MMIADVPPLPCTAPTGSIELCRTTMLSAPRGHLDAVGVRAVLPHT